MDTATAAPVLMSIASTHPDIGPTESSAHRTAGSLSSSQHAKARLSFKATTDGCSADGDATHTSAPRESESSSATGGGDGGSDGGGDGGQGGDGGGGDGGGDGGGEGGGGEGGGGVGGGEGGAGLTPTVLHCRQLSAPLLAS